MTLPPEYKYDRILGTGRENDLAGITNPFQFKGNIAVNTDFPLLASVVSGWFYAVTANVTDNAGGGRTNTGQSFIAGEDIAWNGTNWTSIGGTAIWTDNGTDVSTSNTPRNVALGAGGLKDTNVSTAIKLGDALNTSFTTTNKTIVGSVNEVKSLIPTTYWSRAVTTVSPTTAGDDVSFGTGGLKDTNVSTAIKLGDALNTSFTTTNKTIVGALNEVKAALPTVYWGRTGTTLSPNYAGDDVSFGSGGLKDSDVSTAIKLGLAPDVAFSTTKKSIVGAVNELAARNQVPTGTNLGQYLGFWNTAGTPAWDMIPITYTIWDTSNSEQIFLNLKRLRFGSLRDSGIFWDSVGTTLCFEFGGGVGTLLDLKPSSKLLSWSGQARFTDGTVEIRQTAGGGGYNYRLTLGGGGTSSFGQARQFLANFAVTLDAGYKFYLNGGDGFELNSDAHYLNFGPIATDGSWRRVRSGNNLLTQRRESGAYVTKATMKPVANATDYQAVGATPYNITATGETFGVNVASASSVVLPSAVTYAERVIHVKDESGAAGGGVNVIVITSAAGTIDGGANYTINVNYGGVSFYSNGANWFVRSKF